MKITKTMLALGAAASLVSSAYAIPTVTISDGIASASVSSASGIVTYNNAAFDAAWNVVITTALTKPAAGTAQSPFMDLNIQAISLSHSPVANLIITFSDNSFGPTSSGFLSQLSGHAIGGPGQVVTYNVYYDVGNVVGAQTTALTASGNLADPYASAVNGSLNQAVYSLTQVVTIGGTPAGVSPAGYSLDASLTTVPDGGTTVMLLGSAFALLGVIRRYIKV